MTEPVRIDRERLWAGLAAAEVVVELRRMCDAGTFGRLRATVGNLTLHPARTNVIFDETVQAVIAGAAEAPGLPFVRAMSGAGHDAQEIAASCPTAMVFVAGEHGGISHTPREYSRPESCANGVDVLANAVLTLAGRA